MTRSQQCNFCEILAGRSPASVVYEDQYALAFMDIHPLHPGHALIIPKAHVRSLEDLDEDLWGRMARIGHKIAAALRRSSLRPDGVNLYLADGPAAGQTVFHAHLHVLPRHVGDGSGFRFLGGAAREYTRQELDAHAAELRQGIN